MAKKWGSWNEQRSLCVDTRNPDGAIIPALVPGVEEDRPLATISSTLENTCGERRFFSAMAVAIVVTALAGFARTYFLRPLLPVLTPAPMALTPLIHLHGLLLPAGCCCSWFR